MRRDGADRHFQLSGELDLAVAPDLVERVKLAIEKGGRLSLDLSGLRFVDSSGIRALIEIARQLHGRGNLVLSSARGEVAKVLELVGLGRVPGIVIADGETSPTGQSRLA